VIRRIVAAVVVLWPPTPETLGRLFRRVTALGRVLPNAKRNRLDLIGWMVGRPALLAAINGYEAAVLVSNEADTRMKYLATLKASSLAGCPF
jgi:hypothetical protein